MTELEKAARAVATEGKPMAHEERVKLIAKEWADNGYASFPFAYVKEHLAAVERDALERAIGVCESIADHRSTWHAFARGERSGAQRCAAAIREMTDE